MLSEIIAALSSSDESERCYALEDLERTQGPEAIPHLIGALQDRSARVREAALDLLTKVGNVAVADAAAVLLSSENVPLRNAAIEVLEKIGAPAISVLEQYINAPSDDVRKFAVDTVGKILSHMTESDPRTLEVLCGRLSDEDVNVAGAAAEALGLARNEWAVPFLLQRLMDSRQSSWIQCNIVVALSRISSESSREALRRIDKDNLSSEAKRYLEMALIGEAP